MQGYTFTPGKQRKDGSVVVTVRGNNCLIPVTVTRDGCLMRDGIYLSSQDFPFAMQRQHNVRECLLNAARFPLSTGRA